jgi:hypothetical protein
MGFRPFAVFGKKCDWAVAFDPRRQDYKRRGQKCGRYRLELNSTQGRTPDDGSRPNGPLAGRRAQFGRPRNGPLEAAGEARGFPMHGTM